MPYHVYICSSARNCTAPEFRASQADGNPLVTHVRYLGMCSQVQSTGFHSATARLRFRRVHMCNPGELLHATSSADRLCGTLVPCWSGVSPAWYRCKVPRSRGQVTSYRIVRCTAASREGRYNAVLFQRTAVLRASNSKVPAVGPLYTLALCGTGTGTRTTHQGAAWPQGCKYRHKESHSLAPLTSKGASAVPWCAWSEHMGRCRPWQRSPDLY